jgi:pterin-4a-carbinolamine dehydratase
VGARTLTLTHTHLYTMGMLTEISGYASSNQHHPDLMATQLVNGDNVT